MGRAEDPAATDYYDGSLSELPEHEATLGPFALDKYEVTVGRFRAFVVAYDAWHGGDGHPAEGEGTNPRAPSTGWSVAWSSDLPADAETLVSNLSCANGTWTRVAGSQEASAINCVSWYEAFAFCIWDLGRLPTESEWEFAAAGGAQNRLYPWGSEPPDATRANYEETANSPDLPVGSLGPFGAGYFGHQDLSGSMWEWAFDWHHEAYYGSSGAPQACFDCANAEAGIYRVSRGSAWDYTTYYLRGAARGYFMPSSRGGGMGFRCARAVP